MRDVSYVVGTFLCFPLRVIHILPPLEEESKSKKVNKPTEVMSGRSEKNTVPNQKGVKRTCGNAQKSVRVKHKK